MAAPTELSKSWDRLDANELDAIELMAAAVRPVSEPMADYLKVAVESESGHRAELKSKPRQVPEIELWTDRELSNAYTAAIVIEQASAVSGRLHEWGSWLMHSVCLHMATRLEARHQVSEVQKRCDNN